jgi:hypothetical protein
MTAMGIDFSDLPEPEDIEADDVPSNEDGSQLDNQTVESKGKEVGAVCPTCDQPIYREPGQRGRLAKYHPQCRPSTRVKTEPRGSKAISTENEVDFAVAKIRGQLMRGALLLSMVNQFDGFAVAIAIPDICSNLAGIFTRYEKLRKEVLGVQGMGSVLGLVVVLVTVALPIMANHGLIPGKFVRGLMLNLPMVMYKMHETVDNGAEKMAEVMFEQMKKNTAAKMAARQQTNGA